MTTFSELGLAAPLLKTLEREGYTTPTPIQAQAIPSVLTGADLLGIAQTGTGKTAAFALPILHHLATNPKRPPAKGCRVLVLSPTRELASQIADSFRVYGRDLRLNITTIFGGVAHRPQVRTLARGLDIIVATPGRLLDHVGGGTADLGHTEILVLDEADQMLDLGFVKPIRDIVRDLPSQRQTLFFSATMPREITKLANEFLEHPVKVTVTPVSSTVERINQRIIHIESSKKRALLAELLDDPQMSRTLIFTRTKRGADRVAKHLEARGIGVAAIHGNKSQRQRERALDAFRRAKIQVLTATDIAARGIDIDDVTHVINYELPEVPEAYVHRIGRTARAGASGSAISLCDGGERHLLRAIERLTKQTIPSEDRRQDKELEVEKVEPSRARAPRTSRGAGNAGGRNAGGRNKRPNERARSGRGPERGNRASSSKTGSNGTARTANWDPAARHSEDTDNRRQDQRRAIVRDGAHSETRDRSHTAKPGRANSGNASTSNTYAGKSNSGTAGKDKTGRRPFNKSAGTGNPSNRNRRVEGKARPEGRPEQRQNSASNDGNKRRDRRSENGSNRSAEPSSRPHKGSHEGKPGNAPGRARRAKLQGKRPGGTSASTGDGRGTRKRNHNRSERPLTTA